MRLTLSLANFSGTGKNIGTLNSWFISKNTPSGLTWVSEASSVEKGDPLNMVAEIDTANYELTNISVTMGATTQTGVGSSGGITISNSGSQYTIAINTVTANVSVNVTTKNVATGLPDSGGSGGIVPTTYTFTVNPTPSTATVTLSASGYTTVSGTGSKSINVAAGTAVSWTVSASGYTSQNGTQIVTSSSNKSVTLAASGGGSTTGTTWYISTLNEVASTGKDLTKGTDMTAATNYVPWAFSDNINSKVVGKTINAIEIVPNKEGTFHVGKYNSNTKTYTSMASITIAAADVKTRKVYQFAEYTISSGEYFTFNENGDSGITAYFLKKDIDASKVTCCTKMNANCETSMTDFNYELAVLINVGYIGSGGSNPGSGSGSGSGSTGSTTWYIDSLKGLQDSGNDIAANRVKLQGGGSSYSWAFNELNANLAGQTINTIEMMPSQEGTFHLGVFDPSTNKVTDTRTFTIAAGDVNTVKTYTFADLTIPSGKYFVWNCSGASGEGIGYYVLQAKLDPLAVKTSRWYQAKSTGLAAFGDHVLAFVANIGYTA
jgi:hypothetical protein